LDPDSSRITSGYEIISVKVGRSCREITLGLFRDHSRGPGSASLRIDSVRGQGLAAGSVILQPALGKGFPYLLFGQCIEIHNSYR